MIPKIWSILLFCGFFFVLLGFAFQQNENDLSSTIYYLKTSQLNSDSVQIELVAESSGKNSAISIYFPANYTLYINHKLQHSIFSKGALHQVFLLPKNDTLHQISLLTQNENRYIPFNAHPFLTDYSAISIGDLSQVLQKDLIRSIYAHILAGMFLVISLYYTFLYFMQKEKRLGVFGLISFLFFCLIFLEYMLYHIHYDFTFHSWRLFFIRLVSFCIASLLPLFFQLRFHTLQQKALLLLIPIVFLTLLLPDFTFDATNKIWMLISISISLVLTIPAILKKKLGAYEAGFGIVIWLLAQLFIDNYDVHLFLGFGMLMLFNLISLAMKQHAEKVAHEHSLIRSSRLELELLKKNIQPHYLMNSLGAAIAWMEKHPKKGIQLIEAIADELQQVIDISGEKQITLKQELLMCQSFLKVMSFRKDKKYKLVTTYKLDKDMSLLLPPAVILTLCENAVTHSIQTEKIVKLNLTIFISDQTASILFECPNFSNNHDESYSDGTGTKYIKARLTESFDQNWEFSTYQTDSDWGTKISFKHG